MTLDKHQDTGVMTFILCSGIYGLQIWDRNTDTSFSNVPDEDCCCFISTSEILNVLLCDVILYLHLLMVDVYHCRQVIPRISINECILFIPLLCMIQLAFTQLPE